MATSIESHSYLLFELPTVKALAEGMKLVIENTSQRMRILSSIHDSSHLGVNRSTDMVSCKYYWPGLTKDVRPYVSKATIEINVKYSITITVILP